MAAAPYPGPGQPGGEQPPLPADPARGDGARRRG